MQDCEGVGATEAWLRGSRFSALSDEQTAEVGNEVSRRPSGPPVDALTGRSKFENKVVAANREHQSSSYKWYDEKVSQCQAEDTDAISERGYGGDHGDQPPPLMKTVGKTDFLVNEARRLFEQQQHNSDDRWWGEGKDHQPMLRCEDSEDYMAKQFPEGVRMETKAEWKARCRREQQEKIEEQQRKAGNKFRIKGRDPEAPWPCDGARSGGTDVESNAEKLPSRRIESVCAKLPVRGAIGLWIEDDLMGFHVKQVDVGSAFEGKIFPDDVIIFNGGGHDAFVNVLNASRGTDFSVTLATRRPKGIAQQEPRKAVIAAEDWLGPRRCDDSTNHADAQNRSAEGSCIVLNCEEIGRCPQASWRQCRWDFAWDYVETAVAYYTERGYDVQGVILQSTASRTPPPAKLEKILVRSPVMDECPEGLTSDRLFVVRLAQTYNCDFVDNWNYREFNGKGDLDVWLRNVGLQRKVEYIFDTCGSFLPLRAPGKT